MSSRLPGVRVIFRRTNTAPNPQDLSAFACVMGACSLGTINRIMTLGSLADCRNAGNGEGVEMAAEIGLTAGWPVYLCPVDNTQQAPSAVTKTPASAGVAKVLYGTVVAYGSALFLGADHDGDILYQALASGATIAHIVAGTNTMRSIAVTGSAIVVNVATDGMGAVDSTEDANSILADVLADTAAALLITGSIAGGGDGTSLVAAAAVNTLNNGSVEILALDAAVSARFVLPTTPNESLSVPAVVNGIVVVNLATNANSEPTSTAAQVQTAILAEPTAAALVTPTAVGSGAGKAGALAAVQLDAGAVTYTALTQTPTTVAQVVAGNSTALSVPVVTGGAVIVNVGTDSAGLPVSTPVQIAAAIAARPSAAALVLATGGAGKAGPKATTALQFGSTGSVTVSGTGTDQGSFILEILTPGTVGSSPAPAFKWSADGGNTYSSRTLIPADGIVALRDGNLDTGLTVTFAVASTFEEGDIEEFTCDKPVVASADLLAALDAVILDTSRKFGYVTSPTAVSRTVATQIDTKLQAVKTVRYLRGMFNTRAIAEGVPSETEALWIDSINAEWSGFVSVDGLIWRCDGYFSHISGYSERVYGAAGGLSRPNVIAAAARRSLQAMHQSLAETAMGPLPRIHYQTDPTSGHVLDPGITHDEDKHPGLDDERGITFRTFKQRSDGEIYITRSPTMADPSDVGHSLVMYVNVLMEAARVAADAAFPFIEKPNEGIPIAESALIPAGAISRGDANRMESVVGGAVEALIFKPKSDNSKSASPLAPGEKTITVQRNNDYIADGFLDLELRIRPLGYSKDILIGVTLELP